MIKNTEETPNVGLYTWYLQYMYVNQVHVAQQNVQRTQHSTGGSAGVPVRAEKGVKSGFGGWVAGRIEY